MREEVVYDVQPVWRRGRGWLQGACAEGWANLYASLRDRNFACVWINRFLFNCGFQVMMSVLRELSLPQSPALVGLASLTSN